MVRPVQVEVIGSTPGWNTAVNQNLDTILSKPFPPVQAADLATLTSTFAASQYEHCIAIAADTGIIYYSDGSTWEKLVSSQIDSSNYCWAFRTSGTGTSYWGGYYDDAGSDNDFSPTVTNFGTLNHSYAAHIYFVLGDPTVDTLTLRVTGTSITDGGTRTTSDTENIVYTHPASLNDYKETSKKFIGQVNINVVSGTPKVCNYGWCKYWDAFNTDFILKSVEATWLGGANDTSPDIKLRHHKTTGWTYNLSGAIPPTELESLQGSHVTEYNVANNVHGAWKVTGINQTVLGSASEGIIFEVISGANNAFDLGNLGIDFEYV